MSFEILCKPCVRFLDFFHSVKKESKRSIFCEIIFVSKTTLVLLIRMLYCTAGKKLCNFVFSFICMIYKWGGDFIGGNFPRRQFSQGKNSGGQFSQGGAFIGGNIHRGNFLGGNFLGGNFLGGNFLGGNFLGGNFPDTGKYKWFFSFIQRFLI